MAQNARLDAELAKLGPAPPTSVPGAGTPARIARHRPLLYSNVAESEFVHSKHSCQIAATPGHSTVPCTLGPLSCVF